VQPFRIGIGQGRPRGWMETSYGLCMDPESQYLTVVSSYVGIYANDRDRSMLCHVEDERNKPRYAEAHVQIGAQCPALARWRLTDGTTGRALHDLHFLVGGRRYRPALEDAIEFLIVEKLAAPRPGWDKPLNKSRDEFRRRQLRAAIRRDLPTATQAVKDFTAEP